MAEQSLIEWTDATWNPVTGCDVVSPGCTNCYAMKLAGTRLKHHSSRKGLTVDTKAGPVWNGQIRLNHEWLTQPLTWSRPRMIFVCAHGDLFHENVPDDFLDQVFAVMALAPQHTFQVLTKRSKRMREWMERNSTGGRIFHVASFIAPDGRQPKSGAWPLPNVWLGVSAERQTEADERIPDLLDTPAAIRFVSVEPMIGALDLEPWLAWPDSLTMKPPRQDEYFGCQECDTYCPECPRSKAVYYVEEGPKGDDGCPEWITHDRVTLDWVIVGGESGPGARPMHPDWARSLRDQCAAADVPFFFKQWGNWKVVLDRDKDDPDWRSDYSSLRENNRAIINLAGGMGFHGERVHVVENVGKKAAGRLLDGVEHNGLPAIREVPFR